MADSTKSVLRLKKLRENRLAFLKKKLEKDIQSYDHIVECRDDHTALLKSDWVDENIKIIIIKYNYEVNRTKTCLLYTSPSPRDKRQSRMPSSA